MEFKELINISIGNQVLQIWYEYKSGLYSFEKDIQVGDWTVSRLIKVGGPESSIYKYDFKNYLEFVITDCSGVSRILTWNHNAGDKILGAHRGDGMDGTFSYFFQTTLFFYQKIGMTTNM